MSPCSPWARVRERGGGDSVHTALVWAGVKHGVELGRVNTERDASVAISNAVRFLACLLVLDRDKSAPMLQQARALCPDLRAVVDLVFRAADAAPQQPPPP